MTPREYILRLRAKPGAPWHPDPDKRLAKVLKWFGVRGFDCVECKPVKEEGK